MLLFLFYLTIISLAFNIISYHSILVVSNNTLLFYLPFAIINIKYSFTPLAFAGPAITNWLEEIGLSKYNETFIANGYLEPLYLVAVSEEEIQELGVADDEDRYVLNK